MPFSLTLLRKFPSIYVVLPTILAENGCSSLKFANITTSFAPRDMSTIRRTNSATYRFNFDDLPCPPPYVGWEPADGPYQPQLALPQTMFSYGIGNHSGFRDCKTAPGQGIDGFTTLMTAKGASGPGGRGHPHANGYKNPPGRHNGHMDGKKPSQKARPRPWTPERTPKPAMRAKWHEIVRIV